MPIERAKPKRTKKRQQAVAKRTPEQQALIDKWREDKPLKTKDDEEGGAVRPDADDQELWYAELSETCGVSSAAFLGMILDDAVATAWQTKPASAVNAALALLKDIDPEGPLETLLASQMMATHRVAMEQLRRAMIPEQQPEAVNAAINRANKLLGTFTKQVEALATHRGKTTQQKVIVEHVHVYEGGQAVVGNVNPGDGGRGRKGGKPHASPLADAQESPVWSEGQDAGRAAVPIPCDGKR